MFFYYFSSFKKFTSQNYIPNHLQQLHKLRFILPKTEKSFLVNIYAIISCYQLAELIKHYIMIENIINEQSSSSRHITLDSARTKLRTPMGFLHGLTHKVGVFDPPSVFDANA